MYGIYIWSRVSSNLLKYHQSTSFKIDTSDFLVELNLAFDKLKEGKFDVVSIYYDELKVSVDSKWKRIGKKPYPLKKVLLDKKTMKKYIELAKKQHYELSKKSKVDPVDSTSSSSYKLSAEQVEDVVDVSNGETVKEAKGKKYKKKTDENSKKSVKEDKKEISKKSKQSKLDENLDKIKNLLEDEK